MAADRRTRPARRRADYRSRWRPARYRAGSAAPRPAARSRSGRHRWRSRPGRRRSRHCRCRLRSPGSSGTAASAARRLWAGQSAVRPGAGRRRWPDRPPVRRRHPIPALAARWSASRSRHRCCRWCRTLPGRGRNARQRSDGPSSPDRGSRPVRARSGSAMRSTRCRCRRHCSPEPASSSRCWSATVWSPPVRCRWCCDPAARC